MAGCGDSLTRMNKPFPPGTIRIIPHPGIRANFFGLKYDWMGEGEKDNACVGIGMAKGEWDLLTRMNKPCSDPWPNPLWNTLTFSPWHDLNNPTTWY